MMHKFIYGFIFLFCLSYTTAGAAVDARAFINFKQSKSATIQADANRISELSINQSLLTSHFEGAKDGLEFNNFPITPKETGTIELDRSRPVYDSRTKILELDGSGEKEMDFPEGQFFKGKIKGYDDSQVFMFKAGKYLYAMVEPEPAHRYFISPDRNNQSGSEYYICDESSAKDMLYELYNQGLIEHEEQEYFESSESEDLKNQAYKLQSSTDELLQADIIVDASYDYYEMFDNAEDATAYIMAIMALSSKIFEDNVAVTLFVKKITMRTNKSADPYYGLADLSARLYKLMEMWRNKSEARAFVTLFTSIYTQPSGATTAGLSMAGQPYKGFLCNKSWGYSALGMKGHYQYPVLSYTSDVVVATHEFGHNFSAPHTHSCYFEPNMIDTCITQDQPYEGSDGCITIGNPIPRPGTIMSYCHLTNSKNQVEMRFHERMRPIIRGAAEYAACIGKPEDPILLLTEPLGDSLYAAGATIDISWNYIGLYDIKIMYSSDNGANWNIIEDNYPAIKKSYKWTIPDIESEEMLVMVRNKYEPAYSDTSIASFTVKKPFIELTDPVSGSEIGQKETYEISWESELSGPVIIEFSSDGGNTWHVLAENVLESEYDWEIPDIHSDDCLIRVTSTSDGELVTESGKFGIGEEYVKLITPNGGETLCEDEEFEIEWESNYITKVFIEFSTTGGEKWRKVKLGVYPAADGKATWKPDRYSTEALVRISSDADRETILTQSEGLFMIDTCSIDVVDLKLNNSDNLRITIIQPNPASESSMLHFNSKDSYGRGTITVTDLTGRIVKTVSLNDIIAGENFINLDLDDIAPGAYYLRLVAGDNRATGVIHINK